MGLECPAEELLDLVVIGAGIAGLCAAKTCLQTNATATYAILEAERRVGGVWSLDRLYPNLQTNNLSGYFEFSDFPMSMAGLDLPEDTHIPGKCVYQYLDAYASHFGLYPHIQFKTRVATAEYKGLHGWLLTTTNTERETTRRILTRKLIVSTGLCSRPRLPNFAHLKANAFNAPIFHGKDMASHPSSFVSGSSVVIYGGTKMSWDAAYAYASAGVQVHWVIRKSGHGPCWMAPAHVTPFKLRVENLIMTRAITWFSPCIWSGASSAVERWARHLLQRTWIGRKMVKRLFGTIQGDVERANRYKRSAEVEKLRPWTDFMNIAGGQGVLGYERDVFGMVERGQIKVHVDEIAGFDDHAVLMKEAGKVSADAVVCCTGWRYEPSVKFLPEGIERGMGLPYYRSEKLGPEDGGVRAADEAITAALPILNNMSRRPEKGNATASSDDQSPNQPYRLYRFMAPQAPLIHDRSIAVLGMQINFGVPITIQAQALWIAAYFAGQLPSLIPDTNQACEHSQSSSSNKDSAKDRLNERIRTETLLHTEFCRRRYTWGFGERFPDFMFELLPYLDVLLGDLGLESARKSKNVCAGGPLSWVKGCLREAFEPYSKSDYRGLVEEWLTKQRRTKNCA